MARSSKRSRPIVVVALLIVAAVGGFAIWLAGGGGGTSAAHGQRRAGVATEATQAELARLDEALESSGERARQAGEPTAATAPVASAATGSSMPGVEGELEIIVQRHGDDAPVAGAEVLWWAKATEEDPIEPWAMINESIFEDELESRCSRVVTDEHGKARVGKPLFGGVAVARSDAGWGMSWIGETSEPPVRIHVRPDADIAVDVVDRAGSPVAGARVALRQCWNEWSWDMLTARTAPETGRALLRHVGYRLAEQSGARGAMRVGLVAALREPIERDIDPAALPTEPLRLTLPPTGELEVEILRVDGQPHTDPIDLELRILAPGELEVPANDLASRASVRLHAQRGGRALFPHLEPGLDVIVMARRGANATHSARGRGPTGVGLRAHLTLRLGDGATVVTGRALDAQGQVLANARLNSQVNCGDGDGGSDYTWSRKTDEHGRFELDLQPRTTAERCVLTINQVDKRGLSQGSASRDLPGELRAGVHDLGDVVIAQASLVAAGRVVDRDRNPIGGVWIQTSVKHHWDNEPDNYWWQHAWNLRTQSLADGSFEVRGAAQSGDIALTASKQGWRAPAVIVASGATHVELLIDRTGEIAGQVLADASLASRLRVALSQPGGEESRGLDYHEEPAIGTDGRFVVRNLRPASYSLNVYTASSWSPITTIEDVVVTAGETTRDPRMSPLDLRGSVQAITLKFVGADGKPVNQGLARVTDRSIADEGARERHEWFHSGSLVVTHSGRGVDVDVSVEGYCLLRLQDVVTDQTVTLVASPRVRLVLRDVRMPAAPYQLTASLRPKDQDRGMTHVLGGPEAFDERGEIVLNSPVIGEALIDIAILVRDGERSTSTFGLGDEPVSIEVRDVPGEQRFEVSYDQAKIDQKIAEIAKPKEE